jgi:hypothetical protein
MDLRPKLAREFAEAIYDNMIVRGLSDDPEVREPILNEWVGLIMERFVSHDIPFPDEDRVATDDTATIEAYLVKYPGVRRLYDLAREEALRRWPTAELQTSLFSDPESGHVTCEGQTLTLEIGISRADYPDGHDDWLSFLCDDESPYQKLVQEVGDAHFLFNAMVR